MDNFDGDYWKTNTVKRPRINTSKFLSGLLFHEKVPKNTTTTKNPTTILSPTKIKTENNNSNNVENNENNENNQQLVNNNNNTNSTKFEIYQSDDNEATTTSTTTTTTTTTSDDHMIKKENAFLQSEKENINIDPNVLNNLHPTPTTTTTTTTTTTNHSSNTSSSFDISTKDLKKPAAKKKSRLESTLDGIYWYFDPSKPRKRQTSNIAEIKKEDEQHIKQEQIKQEVQTSGDTTTTTTTTTTSDNSIIDQKSAIVEVKKESKTKEPKEPKVKKEKKVREPKVKKEKKPSIFESIKNKYKSKTNLDSTDTIAGTSASSSDTIDTTTIPVKKEDERIKVSFVLSPTKENKEIRYEFVLLKEKLPKLKFEDQDGNNEDDDGIPRTQDNNDDDGIINVDDLEEDSSKLNRTTSLIGLTSGNHYVNYAKEKNEGFKVFANYDPSINVFVGGKNCLSNSEWMEKENIDAILNATIEVSLPKSLAHLKFFRVSVSDSIDQPINRYFNEAIEFIQSSLIKSPNSSILIHCKEGRSRSTTLAVAYGMKALKLTLKQSYEYVKETAHRININTGFQFQLMEYEKSLYGSNSLNFFGTRKGRSLSCSR